MVSYGIVLAANTVSLLLACGGLACNFYVIIKFLIQMDRKLFVTLHYVFAVPLILLTIA